MSINETNYGSTVQPKRRKNYLLYDGDLIPNTLNYPDDSLGVNETVQVDFEINVNDIGGPADDDAEHTVSAVLDANGLAINSASLKLKHCNYTSYKVNKCNCYLDLDAGSHVNIAGSRIPWQSENICILPEQVTGATSKFPSYISVNFTESESRNVYGLNALSLDVLAGSSEFYSALLLDGIAVHTSRPKSLKPGEYSTEIYNMLFDDSKLDKSVHTLRLKVDHENAVQESNEDNNQTISFKYCWPPDLSFDTSCVVLGNADSPTMIGRCVSLNSSTVNCIYPPDLDHISGSSNSYLNIAYGVKNSGTLNAEPGQCGKLESVLSIDSQVYDVHSLQKLPGRSTFWVGPLNATLGAPDRAIHELALQVTAEDLLKGETDSSNNSGSTKFRFCGFFNELDGGSGVILGKMSKNIEWGETICMRDEDISISSDAEGKTQMSLSLGYTERNIGAKVAEDFSNSIFLNDTLLHTDKDRPPLDVGAERKQFIYSLPVSAAALNEFDQILRLNFDAIQNDVSTRHAIALKFCIEALGREKCACRADLSAGEKIHIGTKTWYWGQKETLCLEPMDMNGDGTFSMAYWESNKGDRSPVVAGYRNRLFFDGNLLGQSSQRPALNVSQTRGPVFWEKKLDLGLPVPGTHTITLEMDFLDDVNEFNTAQGLANNFTMSFQVSFETPPVFLICV